MNKKAQIKFVAIFVIFIIFIISLFVIAETNQTNLQNNSFQNNQNNKTMKITTLNVSDMITTYKYQGKIFMVNNQSDFLKGKGMNKIYTDDNIDVIVEFNQEPTIPFKVQQIKAIIPNISNFNLSNIISNKPDKTLTASQQSSINTDVNIQAKKIETEQDNSVNQIKNKLRYNVNIKTRYKDLMNGVVINIKRSDLDKIKNLPNIKNVWENKNKTVQLQDSVPLINADKVWAFQNSSGSNITGEGIKVAVIDTGIDYGHPDLGGCTTDQFLNGNCARTISGWNFINNIHDPDDDYGHGTHVAGIIGANGGIKGVAPNVSFIAEKVCDSGGSCPDDIIAQGMENATLAGANIMSISLGGFGYADDVLSTFVDNAVAAGVVVVIAAGNAGPGQGTVGSPGATLSAITVGASDKSDAVAWFSSRGFSYYSNGTIAGIKPDILAPGVDINSTVPYGGTPISSPTGYELLDGTSMATPHVSGVVALLMQAHPNWSPVQIKSAITEPSKDLGYDPITQGSGRVDALASYNISAVIIPNSMVLGYMNSSIGFTSKIKILNITNFGKAMSYNFTFQIPIPSVTMTTNETNLNMAANESRLIELNFTIDNSVPAYGVYYINMTMHSNESQTMRVPISFTVNTEVCTAGIHDNYYINNDTTLDTVSCSAPDPDFNGYFIINASNIVFDCNNSRFDGLDPNIGGIGIFNPSYPNVTIKNCILQNYTYGTLSQPGLYCIPGFGCFSFGSINDSYFINNQFYTSSSGIAGDYMEGGAIINNTFIANGWTDAVYGGGIDFRGNYAGIVLNDTGVSMKHLLISGNNFQDNSVGISLTAIGSKNNTIIDNTIQNGDVGIYEVSALQNYYTRDIITDNHIGMRININYNFTIIHDTDSITNNGFQNLFDGWTNEDFALGGSSRLLLLNVTNESKAYFYTFDCGTSMCGAMKSTPENSYILKQWYASVNVTNSSGTPLRFANVSVFENHTILGFDSLWERFTNSNGYVLKEPTTQYTQSDPNVAGETYGSNIYTINTYYPLNITVYKGSYFPASLFVSNITNNTMYNFTLIHNDTFIDNTPPNVYIFYPANNSEYTSSSLNLTINYTFSDNVDVDNCWFSNDTYSVNYSLGSGGNCIPVTNVTWTEGQHNVTVWVDDSSGNVNSSTSSFMVAHTTFNLYSCHTLIAQNSIYNLITNLSSTGTCLNISATNLTVIGNGYSINYSTNRTKNAYGIITNSTLTNIQGVTIIQGSISNSSHGIMVTPSAYNLSIFNNTIFMYGNNSLNNANGIYLDLSKNGNISNNFINSSSGNAIYIGINTNQSNLIESNVVSSILNSGIFISSTGSWLDGHNVLINNTAFSNSSNAISLSAGSKDNTLLINNTARSNSGDGIGLSDINGGRYNTLIGNVGISVSGNGISTSYYCILINNIGVSNSGIGLSASGDIENNMGISNATGASLSGIVKNNTIFGTLSISGNNNNVTLNNIVSNGIGMSFSGNNNNISENIISSNGIGITTSGSPFNNTIFNNRILSNSTGIYLLGTWNKVSDNIATSSSSGNAINIYGSYNGSWGGLPQNNLLINNTATSISGNGIYLGYSSSHNNIINNTAVSNNGSGLNIDWFTHYNNITGNTFMSNSSPAMYIYQPFGGDYIFTNNIAISNYSDGIFFGTGSNNVFINQIAEGLLTGSSGIYFGTFGSSKNLFQDCINISGISYDVYLSQSSTNNTFLNCSYNTSKEYVSSNSQLFREWYYNAYVDDIGGNPINNVNVTALDNKNLTALYLLTNSSGYTLLSNLTDYINNGTRTYYSNYTISANNYSNYGLEIHSYNITEKQNILNDYFTLNANGTDITPPYFVTIPPNTSIIYTEGFGVQFNATDKIAFDSYAINWTTLFQINQSGWLENSTPNIPAGLYLIKITINDTMNNKRSITYKVTVSPKPLIFNVSLTSPIAQGSSSDYTGSITGNELGGDGGCSPVLYRNGVSIATGYSVSDTSILPAGFYNYDYNVTGCSNYTNPKNYQQLLVVFINGTSCIGNNTCPNCTCQNCTACNNCTVSPSGGGGGGGGGSPSVCTLNAFNYDPLVCNVTAYYLSTYGNNFDISMLHDTLVSKYGIDINSTTLKNYYINDFAKCKLNITSTPITQLPENPKETNMLWILIPVMIAVLVIVLFIFTVSNSNRRKLLWIHSKTKKNLVQP